MDYELTIDEIRLILAEFNKQRKFNMVEKPNCDKVKAVKPYPSVSVDVKDHLCSLSHYLISMRWGSSSDTGNIIEFTQRIKTEKLKNKKLREKYENRRSLQTSIDKLINLYLAL